MRLTRGLLIFNSGVGIVLMMGACGGGGSGPSRAVGGSGSGNTSSGMGGNGSPGAGGSGAVGMGGMVLSFGGMKPKADCSVPNPPEECNVITAPGCGDGHINQANEACDDGNSIPGDGCSGVCKVELHYLCPEEGKRCVSQIVCGDGELGPGEACDDKNTDSGDGCSAKCNLVEKGYNCRVPGVPCSRVYLCGDGTPDPNEGCDDGGKADGDGCDAKCRVEKGFKCAGAPSVCSPTKCGDGKAEGAESCDDGNVVPFDGCSVTCQAEPTCPTGAACSSKCGDGILLNEDCDDGNLRNGDGCSDKCKVEVDQGFICNNDAPCVPEANGKCALHVPAIFRDFKASGTAGGHPDFQVNGTNRLTILNLVKKDLDADGKPVYAGGTNAALITSVASFAQWYRTSTINKELVGEIVLWENGKGGFVNRFGPNGEPFKGYPGAVAGNPADEKAGVLPVTATDVHQCQPNTSCDEDPLCVTPGENRVCELMCRGYGDVQDFPCATTVQYFDGQPLFFPVDSLGDLVEYGEVTPAYAINWKLENQVEQVTMPRKHNFGFTSEVKYWFKYDAAADPAQLDFTGDDDVWVFINGHLAVDIGGYHIPQVGSVTLDRARATALGLENGKVYPIAIFQAERKTKASSFRLTLSGFNAAPSDCTTNCGDGKIAPGEECDDGTEMNTGAYDKCSPTCTLGPRCGDKELQADSGEQCDLGADGNTGEYKGCAPNCQIGPHCGDAVVQTQYEKCDDGMNTGEYGTCNADCTLAPHCGDHQVQADHGEECDDGNSEANDGCNPACKEEILR